MVSIRIDDLKSNLDLGIINDLSPEDMNNIQGGIRRIRQPISRERRNSSTGLQSLDSRIDAWQKELNESYDILQQELNF